MMVRRFQNHALALALWGLLCQTTGWTAEHAWLHADAVCRFRTSVSSSRGRQVQVAIPEPLRGRIKGVAAYTRGTPVAASPIVVAGEVAAVWVAVGRLRGATPSPGQPVPLPVEIYLFEEDRVPLPLAAAYRRPALFWRTTRSLLTRPFTSREAVRMVASVMSAGSSVYSFNVDGLGKTIDRPNWQQPPARRGSVMLWNAAIALDEAREVTFGSDRSLVTWFTFVDGLPVGGWRTAAVTTGGMCWDEAVRLKAGIHQVQFFVVQRHGEPIPACLWRSRDNKSQVLLGEFPGEHPEAVEVQFGADLPATGFMLGFFTRYLFEEPWRNFLLGKFTQANGTPFPASERPETFGTDVAGDVTGPDLLAVGLFLPGVALPTRGKDGKEMQLRFPPHYQPLPGTRLTGTIRLGKMAPILSASEHLSIELELSFSESLLPGFLSLVKVTATQRGADGHALSAHVVSVGRSGPLTANLALEPGVTRIEFVATAAGIPLMLPRILRVVHPESDLGGLNAGGDALFRGGERVVLVCGPLATLSLEPFRAGASAMPLRVGLLDDFIAIATAPGASVLPEGEIGTGWSPRPVVFRESIPLASVTGVLPEVARVAALVRLLRMRPNLVILAVGASDLRRQRQPEEISQHLLFLAQAVAAAGAHPVLMALPALPGVPSSRGRRAALLCKELAWRLGIPAVDLYSAETRGGDRFLSHVPFGESFQTAEQTMELDAPGDNGRLWICSLIDQTVTALRDGQVR